MITLNEKTLTTIRKDRILRNKLQSFFNIGERTLYGYIDSNSQRLVTLDALNLITEHLGEPLSELITGGKVSKLLAQ